MTSAEDPIVKQVRAALEYEPRVNLHRHPVRVDVEAGAVVLEGEVESIAARKRALRLAAAIDGVRGVVDRLHVAPTQARSDGEIRDALTALLLGEPELRDCALRVLAKGRAETLRDVPARRAARRRAVRVARVRRGPRAPHTRHCVCDGRVRINGVGTHHKLCCFPSAVSDCMVFA
mgnify:CR=1 FL=1